MVANDPDWCHEANGEGPAFVLAEKMSENIKISLKQLQEICQNTDETDDDVNDLATAVHFGTEYLLQQCDDPDLSRMSLDDKSQDRLDDPSFEQLRRLYAQMCIDIAQLWGLQLMGQPDDFPSNPLADIMKYAKVDA